jgi:hypothetical protein
METMLRAELLPPPPEGDAADAFLAVALDQVGFGVQFAVFGFPPQIPADVPLQVRTPPMSTKRK